MKKLKIVKKNSPPEDMAAKNRDTYTEILLLEYKATYEKICSTEKITINFITIIIALLSIIATIFSLTEEALSYQSMIGVVFLFLLNAMILFAAEYTVKTYSLGGYLKYIEEQINKRCKTDLLRWETYFAEKEQKSVAGIIFMIFITLIFLGICFVQVYLCYKVHNNLYLIIISIIVGVEILLCAVLFYQLLTTHQKTYESCLKNSLLQD